eukprot:UN23133
MGLLDPRPLEVEIEVRVPQVQTVIHLQNNIKILKWNKTFIIKRTIIFPILIIHLHIIGKSLVKFLIQTMLNI